MFNSRAITLSSCEAVILERERQQKLRRNVNLGLFRGADLAGLAEREREDWELMLSAFRGLG